jgi:hypothetical protein
MQLIILIIIFLAVCIVQATDYDINNEQICTNTPFVANFRHNCSRTRLTKDITIPNTNQILYITIIFDLLSKANTSLTITTSPNYNQTVYLTYIKLLERNASLNKTNFTANFYSYDTFSEQITQTNYSHLVSSDPFCYLKNQSLPVSNVTRVYYLYTNETNLNIDFSKSSSGISSQLIGFGLCYTVKTWFSTWAIVLIVLISVFSLVTVILVLICLKKQVTELIHIWKNWLIQKLGMTPKQTIDV